MLNIDSPNEQSFFTKFGGKIKFSTFYQLVKETKELSSYQEEIPESFQKFQSHAKSVKTLNSSQVE